MPDAPPPPAPSHPLAGAGGALRFTRVAFRTAGRIAPGPTARIAEALFVRTQRPGPRDDEAAWLARGERFTVRAAGQTIAAWRWGRGPAVLLAHGWWSHAGRWVAIGGALEAAGHQVIAFDAPGHGRSTGWRASMPEFAATLRAVADAEDPLRAVIGHSLGGAATIFALARGLRAERAVTIAAPADLPGWAHRFRDVIDLPPRAFSRMMTNLERRLRFSWDDCDVGILARRLTLPGLVLHDRHDGDVPASEGETIASQWPGAAFVATSGHGHRKILRAPEIIERVVEFVK